MNLLARSRVRILNCGFDPLTLGETVDRAMELVHHGQRGCICTVNVAVLMMMRADPRLQGFVDRAAIVVADGQPLVWLSRWLRTALPERVAGVDLVDTFAERAENEGLGVYLLGARREVVEAAARRLIHRWPRLKLCGIADGYFSPEEARERVREIAHSGANILLVAMGVPRQEYLLEEHWGQLGVNIAIGVGGSFDVVAGFRIRAPRVVQKLGLEWLFRVAQEPRRLWRRYLVTNSQFLGLATRAVLSRFARNSAR